MSGVQALFYVFAAATCLGAIAVVVSQNVVRMAFWLMISLCSISGLFFLLRADFVAAVQLMIYVGGTVVLLVFGVMLTASGRHAKIKTSPAEGFLAAGIGSLFLTMIISTVASVDWEANNVKFDPQYAALKAVVDSDECFKDGASLAKADIPKEHRSHLDPIYDSVDATELSRSELLTAYDGYQQDDAGNTARPIGLALLGVRPDKDLNKKTESLSIGYLLPFEIASIHLLVVLIGAAYLARAKRRSDSGEES